MTSHSPSFAGMPEEGPAYASQAERRELSEGKTWNEMTASERARYAARKRWDARRMREKMRGDAGHHAQHGAPTTATMQVKDRLPTPVAGLAAGVLDETRDVLLGIIRDPNALDTSKVQAARVLAMLESERGGGATDEVALWLARRDTLLTIPPKERLTWLLGELKDEVEGAPTTEENEDPPDLADLPGG